MRRFRLDGMACHTASTAEGVAESSILAHCNARGGVFTQFLDRQGDWVEATERNAMCSVGWASVEQVG